MSYQYENLLAFERKQLILMKFDTQIRQILMYGECDTFDKNSSLII